MKLQLALVGVARYCHKLLQRLDRAVSVASPGVNLSEAFQHQSAVITILRDGHQIDGMLRLANRQIFLAKIGINLREYGDRARVLRLNG